MAMPVEKECVLVTGSAGFIGFNVAKSLLESGCAVVGVDCFNDYYIQSLKEGRSAILRSYPGFSERRCDIADAKAFKSLSSEFKIDRVCHLAAQAGVRHSLSHPHVYTHSNIEAFLNVLEMARHSKIPRLVYASSSSVYGGNSKMPFSESDRVDLPLSLYAATKRANELMARSYSSLYGIQTIGLRFFTAYGPWGRPDMAMWLFAERILAGKPIDVYNQGRMRRDFTFIDDTVSGVVSALFSDGLDSSEIINLGNNRCEELLRMIKIIESRLGVEAKLNMMPIQAGDVPESFADIELARRKLGYEPKTPIETGIPAFIDWYLAHPEYAKAAAEARAN